MPEATRRILPRSTPPGLPDLPGPWGTEDLAAFLALLKELERHGMLSFLTGLAQRSGELGDRAAEWLTEPESQRFLQNVAIAYRVVRDLDPEEVRRVGEGIVGGIRNASVAMGQGSDLGFWGLRRALKDPAVNRGLRGLLGFLRGYGEAHRPGTAGPPSPPGPGGRANARTGSVHGADAVRSSVDVEPPGP